MTTFYGGLLLLILVVTVGLVVWETWQQSKPVDDDIWIDEEDPRREPNWRRV